MNKRNRLDYWDGICNGLMWTLLPQAIVLFFSQAALIPLTITAAMGFLSSYHYQQLKRDAADGQLDIVLQKVQSNLEEIRKNIKHQY